MTAVNICCSRKHNRILIATDGASYDDRGVIGGIKSKVKLLPQWSAAIVGRGNSFGTDTAAGELTRRAATFDELVSIASRELPSIVEQFGLDRPFELLLIGFFKGRPMMFFIRTAGDHDSMAFGARPYICLPVGPTLFGPWPSDELIAASGFVEPHPDDAPEKVARDLHKLLELQRRTPAEDGFPRVGGFAELTIITPNGIEQRVIHRWLGDRIGKHMSPEPVNWLTWDREH